MQCNSKHLGIYLLHYNSRYDVRIGSHYLSRLNLTIFMTFEVRIQLHQKAIEKSVCYKKYVYRTSCRLLAHACDICGVRSLVKRKACKSVIKHTQTIYYIFAILRSPNTVDFALRPSLTLKMKNRNSFPETFFYSNKYFFAMMFCTTSYQKCILRHEILSQKPLYQQ